MDFTESNKEKSAVIASAKQVLSSGSIGCCLPYLKRWSGYVVAPFVAVVIATLAGVVYGLDSQVRDFGRDFRFRWLRWFRTVFWQFYYPTCGYYRWHRKPIKWAAGSGYRQRGTSDYRWLWRQPKHPNWEGCKGWWVFSPY